MPTYILFDTETTGNGEEDRVIQVGAFVVHDKEKIEVIDELCYSEHPISLEAMEVHHITPEMIESKPPFKETRFAETIERYNVPENFLIAHNIAFDLGMIRKEGFENRYTLIDTVRCAKHLFADLPYYRLQYLRYALGLYKIEAEEAEKLGVSIQAHDAIGDVLVLKLLLSKLVAAARERFEGEHPMATLVRLTQTPVLMTHLRFGKYKDRKIEEIARLDPDYLHWMRKNIDLDEDMAYSIDYYLN